MAGETGGGLGSEFQGPATGSVLGVGKRWSRLLVSAKSWISGSFWSSKLRKWAQVFSQNAIFTQFCVPREKMCSINPLLPTPCQTKPAPFSWEESHFPPWKVAHRVRPRISWFGLQLILTMATVSLFRGVCFSPSLILGPDLRFAGVKVGRWVQVAPN